MDEEEEKLSIGTKQENSNLSKRKAGKEWTQFCLIIDMLLVLLNRVGLRPN